MKIKSIIAIASILTSAAANAACPSTTGSTSLCPITTPPGVVDGISLQWSDLTAKSFSDPITKTCTKPIGYFVNANLDDLIGAAESNFNGCDVTNVHSRYKINWVKTNMQGSIITGLDVPVANMAKSNSTGSVGGGELYYYTNKTQVIERNASKPFSAHMFVNYDGAILTGSDWSNNYVAGVYFGPTTKLPGSLTDANIYNTTFACNDFSGVAADGNYNHVRITINAFEIYRVNGVARSYILKGASAQPKSIEDSVVVLADGSYRRLIKVPNIPGWAWGGNFSSNITNFDQIPVKSLHPPVVTTPTTATAKVVY